MTTLYVSGVINIPDRGGDVLTALHGQMTLAEGLRQLQRNTMYMVEKMALVPGMEPSVIAFARAEAEANCAMYQQLIDSLDVTLENPCA